LLNYLPATVELRTAQAIDTTSEDVGPIGYQPGGNMGGALDGAVAAIPANVDPDTGEIDPTDPAIDTTATDAA
jgi:hypothetical protein